MYAELLVLAAANNGRVHVDTRHHGLILQLRLPRQIARSLDSALRCQIVCENSRDADMVVQLTPPKIMTLEQCLEWIEDDELVEVTPQSIRIRKRLRSFDARRGADEDRGK